MKVKLKATIRIPNMNIYIDIGTILEVIETRGKYYICEYKGYYVTIYQGYVEEINDEC